MTVHIWNTLLAAFERVHRASPAMVSFCPYPADIAAQDITAHSTTSSDLMQRDTGLFTTDYAELRDAFVAAAPFAIWRETYKGTDIGQDFLDRFGCYCLIGAGGAFTSYRMQAYVVYMPAHLHYPWHDHVAEELYYVIAGEAEFHRHGAPSEILTAGGSAFHASSQPHAMTTHDHPVMALVLWRNGFDTPPQLTTTLSSPRETGKT